MPHSYSRSRSSSRQPSQVTMAPSTIPSISNPVAPPTVTTTGDQALPLRHPKPLTASDLHSMLETEQEAMVCIYDYDIVQFN